MSENCLFIEYCASYNKNNLTISQKLKISKFGKFIFHSFQNIAQHFGPQKNQLFFSGVCMSLTMRRPISICIFEINEVSSKYIAPKKGGRSMGHKASRRKTGFTPQGSSRVLGFAPFPGAIYLVLISILLNVLRSYLYHTWVIYFKLR